MKIKCATTSLTIAVLAMLALTGCKHEEINAEAAKVQYTCEMHPEVVTDEPGECPNCHMNLIEKKS